MDIPEWFGKSFDMLMRSDPDASPTYFPYMGDNSLYSASNSTDSLSPGSNLYNSPGPLHTPAAPRKIVGRALKYDDSLFTTHEDSQVLRNNNELQDVNSSYPLYELFPKRSDEPKSNNTGVDWTSSPIYDSRSGQHQPKYPGIEVSPIQDRYLNPNSSDCNVGYDTLYLVTSVKVPSNTSTQFQNQTKPQYWRQANERFVSRHDLQNESDFTLIGACKNSSCDQHNEPPGTPLGSNNSQYGENFEFHSWHSRNAYIMNKNELQLGKETNSEYIRYHKDQVSNQADVQFSADCDQFRRKPVDEFLTRPYELQNWSGSCSLSGREKVTGAKRQIKPQTADRLHLELIQKYGNPESEMQYNLQPNKDNRNNIKLPLVDTSSSSEDIDFTSPKVCMFCRKNGETAMVYTTHVVKEKVGKTYVTTCPILRAHVCPVCKQSGDKSHTISYCPLLKTINGPMQSTTICLKNTKIKSNGRKRF